MWRLIQHRCYFRFRYTTTVRDAFLRDGIASLQNLDNLGWVAGSDANVFVCNHDTERVRHYQFFCNNAIDDPSWCRTPSPSTRTRLQTLTRWLASFPCMLPHYPSSVQRIVSHDSPVHLRAALIHTAHLPYARATAISTTQALEDRTAVRPM
jgi:hypothetical protein